MEKFDSEKYKAAKKKVDDIKGFYAHLAVFITVLILIFLIKAHVIEAILNRIDIVDWNFEIWLDWNFVVTMGLWAIVLVVQGLYVFDFKFKFMKEWEEKKIREILDKENKLD